MDYSEFLKISSDYDSTALLKKKSFFDQFGEDAKLIEDNIRLDYFGLQLTDEYDYVGAELMRRIYAAAKLVFDRHPNSTLVYAASSVYDMMESPYAVECNTPEKWLKTYVQTFIDRQSSSRH